MATSQRILVALLALAALCDPSRAAATRTQVMLIGAYHFSNSGKDLNTVKAVDIRAAQRQREIGKVITALAWFAPTQVAIESIL
jgi:hypothetical protein